MAIHIVSLALKQVVGGSVLANDHTIGQRMVASSEFRVLPDSTIPNSSGSPNPVTYIKAEHDAGFELVLWNQSYIVTSSAAGGVASVPFQNSSGTATTSSAVALLENTGRKYFELVNTGSVDLWFAFGGTATTAAPSKKLVAGASYVSGAICPTNNIAVRSASSTCTFSITWA